MQNRRSITLKSVIATLVAGLIGITVAWQPGLAKGKPGSGTPSPYIFTDLGGFTGGPFVQAEAYAISNPDAYGVVSVTGKSYITSSTAPSIVHPPVWEVSTAGSLLGLFDIGTPPGIAQAIANDINDAGWATGETRNSNFGDNTGFVFVPGAGCVRLPGLDGGCLTRGYGINNYGDVVGIDDCGGGLLWHVDASGNVSTPIDLGDFDPYAINDLGVMAGQVGASSGNGQPAIARIDGTGLHVMVLPGATYGIAYAINNHNDVVGDVASATPSVPFYCPAGGTVTPLPTLGGGRASARGINDQGQIVGWADYPRKGNTIKQVGVIWKNGVLSDLNKVADAGTSNNLQQARGINNLGQIVGMVYTSSPSEIHGYLLTPRP